MRMVIEIPRVPELEPEVIAASARKRGVNVEKVPTTTVSSVSFHGIVLTSRYQIAHEFDQMIDIVQLIPETTRRRIASIWCDSKIGCSYSVTVLTTAGLAETIDDVRNAVVRSSLGFNELAFCEPGEATPIVTLDPEWIE